MSNDKQTYLLAVYDYQYSVYELKSNDLVFRGSLNYDENIHKIDSVLALENELVFACASKLTTVSLNQLTVLKTIDFNENIQLISKPLSNDSYLVLNKDTGKTIHVIQRSQIRESFALDSPFNAISVISKK